MVLRPGYQAMLADARAHCFDTVVAGALDRLSRDQEDAAALYTQLRCAGVRLITLSEGGLAQSDDPGPPIHPQLAEIYCRKVAALHAALDDEATRDDAFAIIRSLVEAVVLTPDNGELRIDLHGEIAAILGLCVDSKKPATDVRDGLAQIKVVAGARNQRYQQGLFQAAA